MQTATTQPPLAPGDILTIYQDPITEKRAEGRAKLLSCIDPEAGGSSPGELQRWQVRFVSDGFITERFIRPSRP